MSGRRARTVARRRGPISLALSLVACALLAPSADAEIVRDPPDSPGPLDVVALKVGQDVEQFNVQVKTDRRLPQLQGLDPHPSLAAGDSERYLCVSLTSQIGHRLLCPAGEVNHHRLEVGISAVHGGNVSARGAVTARVERQGRTLSLQFTLRKLGLKAGNLRFAAQSSWYGPECVPPPKTGPAGPGRADEPTCLDRAPQRGSGRSRIYPLRRSGCGGFDESSVFNGSRGNKRIALTFDDGPSAYTSQVLKILIDHHVHATFFQVGEQIPSYPSAAREILATGNEIGNHSLHHESGPGEGSLRETQRLIEAATGFTPCMFRPPYGTLPGSTLSSARALDLVTVLWDVDTQDYTLPGSGTIAQRATSVQPGSIVLMHDGGGDRSQTVAALPGIIENLKKRGYELVTLTRLLGGHFQISEDRGRHSRLALPPPAPFPLEREGP